MNPQATDDGRPSRSALFAVALVTADTLALQVVITRLFSAVLAYHFSFLAVSLALLGTGAGALLIYVRPDWFQRRPTESTLARLSLALAATLIVLPFLLVRLDFTYADAPFSYTGSASVRFALNLAAACGLAALPSLVAGIIVALAIDRYRRAIGAVYAFDLVGAGIGALAIVPLLWLASAPALMVSLGVLAALAAFLFAPVGAASKRVAAALAIASVGLTVLSVTTRVLYVPHNYALPEGATEVGERWTPLARVLGFSVPNSPFALVFYDRVYAPVPVVVGESLPDWRRVKTGPQSIGYALTGPGRALIIGGGGGRDIYTALSSGQRPVDVIELNGGIRAVVDEDLGTWSRAPYSREGVSTTIGDGRSVLASRDTSYDQIHIGFTDTLSANAAQGFALTENNLYTVEAFQEYLDHLAPYGILNVSRLLKLVGDEALRATVLTLASLERYGIEDPRRNVVVVLGNDVLGPPYGTILARKEPFTEEELGRIRSLAAQRGTGIAFAPGGPYYGDWATLARATSLQAFCASHPLDVCPPTDDKPFFFSMKRLAERSDEIEGYIYSADPMSILLLTVVVLGALSAVAFVLPMAFVRHARRPKLTALTYFGALGVGFLALEITLIQRFVLFLGYPTYALSVVLCALLVFSGIGSYLSSLLRPTRTILSVALATTTALIVVAALWLPNLLHPMMDLGLAARIVVALITLAPLGVMLGMAMPLGLQRFSTLYPSSLPYAWGVNGITSVLASALAMAVAIHFGFAAATLLSAACYAFACGHALLGDWPEAA